MLNKAVLIIMLSVMATAVTRADMALVLDGITMVPIKPALKHLSHIDAMQFFPENLVTITMGDKTLNMALSSTTATVNGKAIRMPQPALIYQKEFYVPLPSLVSAFDWQIGTTPEGFITITAAVPDRVLVAGEKKPAPYVLVPAPMTPQYLARRQQPMAETQAQALFNTVVAGNTDEVIQLLKAHPELIYAPTARNDLSIHMAARIGNKALITALLANGASLDDRGNNGNTPLHTTIAGNAFSFSTSDNKDNMSTLETYPKPSDKQILDTMSFLIERGANIHTADEDGNTVLHLAINNHNPEMIKLLLARGAKADAKNNEGKTAYQCAKEFDMKEVMAVFPESTQ